MASRHRQTGDATKSIGHRRPLGRSTAEPSEHLVEGSAVATFRKIAKLVEPR
jgi:hypothetical protein